MVAWLSAPSCADVVVPFTVTGDAIVAPLAGRVGDASRGRAIVLDRGNGNCLMCHVVPNEPSELQQGTVGPSLVGLATRLSVGQIRLRLVDQSRVHPDTVMPPYHRVDGLARVAAQFRGRPFLDAREIEDVVAYLSTLR
jgi:L-cysteine S-thiosulfotransferase